MGTGFMVVAVFFFSLFLLAQFLIFLGNRSGRVSINRSMDRDLQSEGVLEEHRVVFENGSGISFGHNGEIMYFFERENKIFYMDLSRQDIDYEVVLGENIVSRKNVINTAGKAVVGGAMLGGIGVIAGVLLGTSRQSKMFNKVEIRLRFMEDGEYLITRNILLDTGRSVVADDSPMYEHAMKQLDYIIGKIETSNYKFE